MVYVFGDPINESGSINLKSDSTATLDYIIDWEDLSSAISTALAPVTHYRHSGLICKTVSYSVHSPDASGSAGWNKAALTLSFAPKEDEDEQPGDIAEINVGITGETVSLPKKHYTLAESGSSGQDSGDKLDGLPNPSKILPEANMSIKINNATTINTASVFGLVGKVNGAAWQGIHAKGGLFLGVDTNRVIRDDGTETYTKTFSFAVKPTNTNWNEIWNPKQGTYISITPDLYETGDFNDLF